MRLFSNRTPHRNRNPLPPPRWENYTRRSFVCGALFLTFPEKTSKNQRHFLTIPENICSLFIQLIE